MKYFLLIISFFIFCSGAFAQNESTAKYVWQNEITHTKASVEVFSGNNDKSIGCIFFITNVDTAFISRKDSLFYEFSALSNNQYNVVKISFYDLYDSSNLSSFSTELIDFILPDIKKKFKALSKSNAIISGINQYAMVALYAATHFSDKVSKTALFFDEYQPSVLLTEDVETVSKKIKGKLFMYVNNVEEDVLTDTLAENLALNSSVLLYKYDDVNAAASKRIFMEAYNWLMADGNNYVLKVND